MVVGDYFEGQFEVCNVVGSSGDGGNKAQFWSQHTKRAYMQIPAHKNRAYLYIYIYANPSTQKSRIFVYIPGRLHWVI